MQSLKTRKDYWQHYRHNYDYLTEHEQILAFLGMCRVCGLPLSAEESAVYNTAVANQTNHAVNMEEILSGFTLDGLLERKETTMENGTQTLVRESNTFGYES